MESFLDLFNTDNSNSKFKKLSLDKYENEDIDLSDSNNSTSEDSGDRLPPEPEQGNIEYKLKLVNPSNQRFEHLVTQMKWRLQEGHGKAIYQIGVEDNGRLAGLSKDEMNASLKTLEDMATRLGATIDILKERFAYHKCNNKKTKTKTKNRIEDKKVAEVLIRKLRRDDKDEKCVTDLRLAVMGSQDAGKSTLLGVLTQGELDNGRGRSRLNMLRHLHEIKSGRTSSISHEIIGFDNKGHVLNYAEMSTAEKICEHASKVVTFIDLAGHRKYLRTTILGLTGYSPHYVMLVVAPPINEVVQEHVALCLALHVPFFVVFTKVDLGYYNPQETLSELKSISTFQGCHKNFLLHNSSNNNSNQDRQNNESNVISVFSVSCVTGEGLSDLKNFIRDLVPVELSPPDLDPDSCLFQIDEIFRVAGYSKPVLGGLLVKGIISLGTRLLVGPAPDGKFSPAKVVSLHRNKAPCCFVRASQSASLTLTRSTKKDPPLPHLRPGMVLVSFQEQPHATLFFQATVIVVFHATAIYPGFQATVHIGNVRQTCVVEGIMGIKKGGLQTNDTASVLFRFLTHPEYVHVEMRLLLREGRTKAIGKVTQIFPLK